MPVTLNKTPFSRGPTTTPHTTKDLLKKLFEQVGNKTSQSSQTTAPKSKTAHKPTNVYNDIFKSTGSFTIAGGKVEILWRQAHFIKGMKYPPKSKAISYAVYQDGKKKNWPLNGPAYLDSNGRVHLPVRSPNLPRTIRSEKSFLSDNFSTLVKAIKQIRAEGAFIKHHGLKKLSSAVKDKHGEVVTTQGALLLGAVIKSLGAKKVAHKQSALAVRVFDNVQRLLKMSGMGEIVQNMMDQVGLKVEHKSHGRSLLGGETSAAGERRVQFGNMIDLVNGAPQPPWIAGLVRLLYESRYRQGLSTEQRNRAAKIVQEALDDPLQRQNYAGELAQYFINQKLVFKNKAYPGWVREPIARMLDAAANLRNGHIDAGQYREQRAIALGELRRHRITMPAEQFMRMLEGMPGFQRTAPTLRMMAAIQLARANDLRRLGAQLHEVHGLSPEIMRTILLLLWAVSGL